MTGLHRRCAGQGIHHMAFGDLFWEDVRASSGAATGGDRHQPLFPLWGSDTTELAQAMIDAGPRPGLQP